MERTKGKIEQRERTVTGEVVYLDEMRRADKFPEAYDDLPELAIQNYEEIAALCIDQGTRPDIMTEYERIDKGATELQASCTALAEELLRLKDPNSPITSVGIVVDRPAEEVIDKLYQISAGRLLEDDDAQLAIPSDGEYYPILDIKKRDAKPTGVGVVVWGWSDHMHAFVDEDGKRSTLMYPGDEQMSWYQLDVVFSYMHADAGTISEKITLSIGTQGDLCISSNVWVSAYAEMGYEGHLERGLDDCTEKDVAAFADLIADIVGDSPESVSMRQDHILQKLIDEASTPELRTMVQKLIDVTWPAQAYGLLVRTTCGDAILARAITNPEMAEQAKRSLEKVLVDWTTRFEGVEQIDN